MTAQYGPAVVASSIDYTGIPLEERAAYAAKILAEIED